MSTMTKKMTHATARPWDTSHTVLRMAGAALALVIAAIHLLEAGDITKERVYVGVLFYGGASALLYTFFALVAHRDSLAWLVGGGTAGLMLVGGILSRTTGLPGFHESTWRPALILSIVLEVLLVGLWGIRTLADIRR